MELEEKGIFVDDSGQAASIEDDNDTNKSISTALAANAATEARLAALNRKFDAMLKLLTSKID